MAHFCSRTVKNSKPWRLPNCRSIGSAESLFWVQTATSRDIRVTAALPLKADVRRGGRRGSFGPILLQKSFEFFDEQRFGRRDADIGGSER
jgi:hypothetical protein